MKTVMCMSTIVGCTQAILASGEKTALKQSDDGVELGMLGLSTEPAFFNMTLDEKTLSHLCQSLGLPGGSWPATIKNPTTMGNLSALRVIALRATFP